MKRVLYVATSPSHKRAFEAFSMSLDMRQRIALPGKEEQSDIDNFKIETRKYYQNKKELQAIIDEYKPDVYVEASLPCGAGVKLPSGCKKVYVSHGLVGNHVKGMIKSAGLRTEVWKGCDLYCGAWDDIFIDWVMHVAKVDRGQILTDALPQLDILHNGLDHYRDRLKYDFPTKPNCNKVVAFFGFCCKDRVDFHKHNEDYFHTAIELSRLSKRLDFLTYIKPRQERKKLLQYLRTKGLGKVLKDYESIDQNRERVKFIGPTQGHVLDYYFADIFVVNGCSTVEIEACALGKPLFVVRTKQNSQHGYDPYDTVKSGAAVEINDIKRLDQRLADCIRLGRYHYPDKQKELLNKMGITFDGKAHKRIQDRLLEI